MAKENTASTTDQVSPVKDVEQKKPAPPAPEVSEVKPEPPANEGPASLFEMAEGPTGPVKKDIPSPENVVIPFEKINEIKAEKKAASGKAAKTVDEKQPKPPTKDAVKKESPAPAKTPKQSKAPKDEDRLYPGQHERGLRAAGYGPGHPAHQCVGVPRVRCEKNRGPGQG